MLLAILEDDGEARVVLTKRPEGMATHSGEIAFPGGKIDPVLDRNPRDAALREAEEEIDLPRHLVEIVGRLEPIGTLLDRFTISPFVGLIEGRPLLTPHVREVDRIIEVPITELLDDGVFREELWAWDDSGIERSIQFFDLEDETVWGATARILTSFLAHMTGVPVKETFESE